MCPTAATTKNTNSKNKPHHRFDLTLARQALDREISEAMAKHDAKGDGLSFQAPFFFFFLFYSVFWGDGLSFKA